MTVMEARNDVELVKALECMICFEICNREANSPIALNPCGHKICCRCMRNVFKCHQCRKGFLQLSSKENKTVRKLLELEHILI